MEATTEISPLEVVQQCYADFGVGNIPGVLNALTDDVKWTDPGHVGDLYVGKRVGKAAIADFFTKLNQHLDITELEVKEYIAKGKKVVSNGYFAGTARSTGKTFTTDFSMTWRVNKEGKVSRHHLYLDTYVVAQAMGLAS
ncbi:MAG: nuclear transport factor 2 family protein [Bacteroidota bacterium]